MTRRAFVFGSDGSEAFKGLKYSRDDADRFAKILIEPRYGFEVTRPSAPSDPYQIKKELDRVAKACKEEDTFIFFFSGHGELFAGELMFVLDGTVPGDETTYLPATWVKEARTRCAADNRLIILDCCHAGGAIGAKDAPAPDLIELGLETKTELMLLASRRLELAREIETLRGSFLTSQICAFLSTAQVPVVTLGQLMAHLQRSARDYNRLAANGLAKVPIPFLSGEQQGDFLFAGQLKVPDLSEFVTIRDQGNEGSPASVAMVCAMETSLRIKGQAQSLSARYLREKSRQKSESGKRDVGEQFPPVVFIVEQFGVPPESLWPWVAGQTKLPRGMTWRRLDYEAVSYKARCFRLRNIDEIETHLALRRPVLAPVTVHAENGWMEKATGLIQPPTPNQTVLGGHCVVIVARKVNGFRFANVWGTTWGDQGFGEMSEEVARTIVEQNDLWAVEML